MIGPAAGPTLLIVDEDVGFVWWLGELFNEVGYRSIPALGCMQALSLFRATEREIEFLIINPHLRGAERLIEILSRANPLKVVVIQEGSAPEIFRFPVVAAIERPTGFAPVGRGEWRIKIQRLLRQIGSRAAS